MTIEDVLEKAGIAFPFRTKKISCPNHSDTDPSLHLYEDSYHCFSCGATGNPKMLLFLLTGERAASSPFDRSSASKGVGRGRIRRSTHERLRALSLSFFPSYEGLLREYGAAVYWHMNDAACLFQDASHDLVVASPEEAEGILQGLRDDCERSLSYAQWVGRCLDDNALQRTELADKVGHSRRRSGARLRTGEATRSF